jgi:hypothetical protein
MERKPILEIEDEGRIHLRTHLEEQEVDEWNKDWKA